MAVYGVFAATERLLMELARQGADRQEMHERIREHAMAAWEAVHRGQKNPLVERLSNDEVLLALLPAERMRELLHAARFVGDAPARCAQFLQHLRKRLAAA
jgi:adenylosuccinate lyase